MRSRGTHPPPGDSRGDLLFQFGALMVGIIGLVCLFGPWLAPFDPTASGEAFATPPPPFCRWPALIWAAWSGSSTAPVHWFGTDAAGLDVLSGTLVAARTDVLIAVVANASSLILGVGLGLLSGYFHHWSTALLVRFTDVLQSFPVFITAMILVALAGRSATNIIIAMTLVYTPIYVRLTRSEVMIQRQRGYVEAARALGCTEARIATRYVLPNSLRPALTQSSITIGFAILLTSGLSFVGAGVRPPTPEWGLMIANGAGDIVLGEWWQTLFPGLAISLTVFSFAALGHGWGQRVAL